MRSSRVLFLIFTCAIGFAAVTFVPRPGQAQDGVLSDIVVGLGLPAIDVGVLTGASRAPHTADAMVRRSIRASSAVPHRIGTAGAAYAPGRVIVKFRGGVSTASRLSTLSVVSRTASNAGQPSGANFDVVTIDASEDAEA